MPTGVKKCLSCGIVNGSRAKTCKNCGKPFPTSRRPTAKEATPLEKMLVEIQRLGGVASVQDLVDQAAAIELNLTNLGGVRGAAIVLEEVWRLYAMCKPESNGE